jgi:serine/threonine protein phosphatase 1
MLFAIGDIHGHYDKFLTLVGHCRAYSKAHGHRHPRFVLLGDYIDRGPASRQMLEFLLSSPPDFTPICGNHEDMMRAAVSNDETLDLWRRNGGVETLASYGTNDVRKIPHEHLDLIDRLPLFVDDGLRLFVHAGIDVANPQARDRRVLMWTRIHPAEDVALPRFLVHGHTPTRDGRPELKRNRLNLDTGAGWGRKLTAAAFLDDLAPPAVFLTHLGEATVVTAPKL